MPSLIQFAKSRTNQFAMALTILGMVQGFIVKLPLSPEQQAAVAAVVGVAIVGLRWITTVALHQK